MGNDSNPIESSVIKVSFPSGWRSILSTRQLNELAEMLAKEEKNLEW